MLSSELEFCLNDAFQQARAERHEYMTVEHLLLALLSIPHVEEILRSCGADLERLRKDLKAFVDDSTPRLPEDSEADVQPTLGFQRVLQRAVFHVQSSGKKEVRGEQRTGRDLRREAVARGLPADLQDVSRLDVVNFISHGVSKVGDGKAPAREIRAGGGGRRARSAGQSAGVVCHQPERAGAERAASIR